MASVDGSKSVNIAFDEMYEMYDYDCLCKPCIRSGIEIEARQYCQDCGEYICGECTDYHEKLSVTQTHKIVRASGTNVPDSSTKIIRQLVLCGCNTNQEVEDYCEDHLEAVCSPCKNFRHHKCKTNTIQQMCSAYTTSNFLSTLSKTKALKDKYDQLKQESIETEKELQRLKDSCKREIQMFRKELDTFLDQLEKDMLAKLDTYERVENHNLNKHVSTLTTALKMLDSEYKLLEKAKKEGRKKILFLSDMQVSRGIKVYENRLNDLQQDVIKPSLIFQRNEKLNKLSKYIDKFGFLETQTKTDSQNNKEPSLGRDLRLCKRVNVKSKDDEYQPWISGCVVMPNGYVVLCDYKNSKIKILDSSLVLKESIKEHQPCDAAVIDANNVMVSLPNEKQLRYLQIFPKIEAGRYIKLNKGCWGVEVVGGRIYVTCHNKEDDGEVRVLDLNGRLKRRLGVIQDGGFMFRQPYYITVSKVAEKVFVSDFNTSTITCMTVDGHIIYQYQDDEMKAPCGLCCDAGDAILVCGNGSDNMKVITPDGNLYCTILTAGDKFKKTLSVSYIESDDTLIIGCRDKNHHMLLCRFQ